LGDGPIWSVLQAWQRGVKVTYLVSERTREALEELLSRTRMNQFIGVVVVREGWNLVEEDGFIESVREAPHDEDIRLIYADWLEERGDLRAEFLRIESSLRGMTGREPSYQMALTRWLQLRDRVPTDWIDRLGWRVNGLLLPQTLVDLLTNGHGEPVLDTPKKKWHQKRQMCAIA
jgi:uncharacterized protein (TIGR02996 family)